MRRPDWWLVACLAVLVLILWQEAGRAAVSEADMVRAVIGEADNQGELGMELVAHALINRGTLKGVYGYKAIGTAENGKLTRKGTLIAPETLKRARNAVSKAIHRQSDPTNGAKHWENVSAFGTPYWAEGLKPSVCYKDHCFYKGVK